MTKLHRWQRNPRLHAIDGVTEGGSSGSPLYNDSWEVVGQLYGVCCSTSCNSINFCTQPSLYNNVYGRFSTSYVARNCSNNSGITCSSDAQCSGGSCRLSMSTVLNTIIPDDVHEDNDSMGVAAGLDPGTHDLRLVDFDDYFKITLSSDSDLTITTTFSTSDMDLDLYLLDDVGTIVDSSVTLSGIESIVATVPAGIYYIHAFKDTGWGGNYTLDLSAFLANCPQPAMAAAEPSPRSGVATRVRARPPLYFPSWSRPWPTDSVPPDRRE